ncbi:hypothetical protein ES705_05780 [subsurface metagenome]
MSKILTKRQAVQLLGLDKKIFENYFKNAGEINCLPRTSKRGRFLFKEDELKQWLEAYKRRILKLSIDDYKLCLDFALAMHFRGYVLSDWGGGRQREFGQKISNWVRGQLGEVAVKKFFKREFDVDVKLDFNLHKEIVPQDIIGVLEKGKIREPKINIGIKASKPKNAYLVLGKNEVVRPERRSEFYIFCRPDLPDDHLLRIARKQIVATVKEEQHYPVYKDKMPSLSSIPCEVAGWCLISELEEVTSIPGQSFEGIRFVRKSGLLYRSREKWKELLSRL